jgi:hypothetical protein
MRGVEFAALGAGTAERSAETAGTVVAGTGTAHAGHNLLSGLLDGTGVPSGEVKRGRMLLPDRPRVVAFLFSSPALYAWTPR